MTRIEKQFVNRKKQSKRNIQNTIDDIENAFRLHKFKTLFFKRLAHGPLSQYHYVLQHH